MVLVQWSCAIQARSKRLSILQRPFNNWVLTFALVFETILAFLIIYSPGAASGLQLAPLSPLWYVYVFQSSNIKPWTKKLNQMSQVAARLRFLLGTNLLWGAEEGNLKETSRSLGGPWDSILNSKLSRAQVVYVFELVKVTFPLMLCNLTQNMYLNLSFVIS